MAIVFCLFGSSGVRADLYEHRIVQQEDRVILSDFNGYQQVELEIPAGWYRNDVMAHYGYYVVPSDIKLKHRRGWAHAYLLFLSQKKKVSKNVSSFWNEDFVENEDPYMFFQWQPYGYEPEARDKSYLDEQTKIVSRVKNQINLGSREELELSGLNVVIREYEFEKEQHLSPNIFRLSDKYIDKGKVKAAIAFMGYKRGMRMFLFCYLAPPKIYEQLYPVFKKTLLSITIGLDSAHHDLKKEELKKTYQVRLSKKREERSAATNSMLGVT
jgi:hypothetical protein